MDELEHLYFEGFKPLRETHEYKPLKSRLKAPSRKISTYPAESAEFANWVLLRMGFDPNAYRTEPMQRRVPACLRVLKVPDIQSARKLLEQNPELFSKVVEIFFIGVTEFLRDPQVFHHLTDLIDNSMKNRDKGLRVLSAGCSSGHELYSLVFCLDQAGLLEKCDLQGIDCRSAAIEKAKTGVFLPAETSVLADELRQKYFEPAESRVRVTSFIRNKIQWRVADLNQCEIRPYNDIILFRNLSIYLSSHSAEVLWNKLARGLARGGFLVTGKTEKAPRTIDLDRVNGCIYRKI